MNYTKHILLYFILFYSIFILFCSVLLYFLSVGQANLVEFQHCLDVTGAQSII